jgi:hypothetical protein
MFSRLARLLKGRSHLVQATVFLQDGIHDIEGRSSRSLSLSLSFHPVWRLHGDCYVWERETIPFQRSSTCSWQTNSSITIQISYFPPRLSLSCILHRSVFKTSSRIQHLAHLDHREFLMLGLWKNNSLLVVSWRKQNGRVDPAVQMTPLQYSCISYLSNSMKYCRSCIAQLVKRDSPFYGTWISKTTFTKSVTWSLSG